MNCMLPRGWLWWTIRREPQSRNTEVLTRDGKHVNVNAKGPRRKPSPSDRHARHGRKFVDGSASSDCRVSEFGLSR